jgi:beta-N-acetylhexosaminidase
LGVLRTWSSTRLAEQLIAIPVDENAVESVAGELSAGAGGLLLFGNHAPADLAAAIARAAAGEPGRIAPLVMTDEEGGSVQRMANLVGWLPSARTMATTLTPAQIRLQASQLGSRLRANGVTMDLAPVLDLDSRAGPTDQDPIGDRSFSDAPATASAAALAFAAGLRQGGVIAVLKHFPGIGGGTGNSDLGPAVDPPWSGVAGRDLLPFLDAIRAGASAVMVSNVSVPGLTNLPASLSPAAITKVLRGQLGFTGLVITDSLSAGAVQAAGYPVPRAAVAAVAAGADMVIFNSYAAATAALTAATAQALAGAVQAGTIPRARLLDAAAHVLAAKHVSLCR